MNSLQPDSGKGPELKLREAPWLPPRQWTWLKGVFLFVILAISPLHAAESARAVDRTGVRWEGDVRTIETIADIMARAESSPIQFGSPPRHSRPRLTNRKLELPSHPRTVGKSIALARQSGAPPKASLSIAAPDPLTIGVSFLGAQSTDSDVSPPDSMGDVGPTQFLVCVNGRIRVFDKQGVEGSLDTPLENFFADNSVSDPRVRYDRLTRRWFVTAINIPASNQNNKLLIAVSDGPVLVSSSSFQFYSFQHNLAAPSGDSGRFADYPTLGIDRHALYVGVNVFDRNDDYVGATGYVINKSNLLTGTLTVTAFRQLAVGNSPGLYSPQGVDNDDPASTEGYFIGIDNSSPSLLVLRRVSNPGGTPSISENLNLAVPLTGESLGGVPSRNSAAKLDDVDNRLFGARMHQGSLWTAHNLEVDSSGTASTTGGRDGARWYEVTNLKTSPTLRQSGTLFDAAATRPASYWIPTCAVSGQGHMALGCSVAGLDQFAEIAMATRLAGDELGTLRAPRVVQTSRSPYGIGSITERWGDYSVVTLDPNDGMTFWTVQEYCLANNSWGVRVIQLLAPPPATPTSCRPAAVLIGATNVNITVTGTVLNGSGFFDPGPDYTNHLSATFNDAAITINHVTYTDPEHVTFSVSISSGATNGNRTLSITNPDGQTVASAPGLLTLTTQPIIESISKSGDSATITWYALEGKSYRVQYKSDLPGSAWTDLSGNVTATSGLASKIDVFGSATERYYQVIVLP